MPTFTPEAPLTPGYADPPCQAVAIIPARNEELTLVETLDAFARQVDMSGQPLPRTNFEILLLLNNCTDSSASVAQGWKLANPGVPLHIIERTLSAKQAHVGTARRLLMDTAWHRLRNSAHAHCGILSTDSDTVVAPDWISRNLAALHQGADAVGGVIGLKPGEFERLSQGTQRAYMRDRQYQRLIAELEDHLDPQAGDPWPRHLEHFGASLACTPEAYARAGGMPPVTPLEDKAFVDAVRRVDGRLRHDPAVTVYTSARLDGRATIGFAHQLRTWENMSNERADHCVPSASWITHRFKTLRILRNFFQDAKTMPPGRFAQSWRERMEQSRGRAGSIAEFLIDLDCDRLIQETFSGDHEGSIVDVIRSLARVLDRLNDGRAS